VHLWYAHALQSPLAYDSHLHRVWCRRCGLIVQKNMTQKYAVQRTMYCPRHTTNPAAAARRVATRCTCCLVLWYSHASTTQQGCRCGAVHRSTKHDAAPVM
jgi:hypothetical protein